MFKILSVIDTDRRLDFTNQKIITISMKVKRSDLQNLQPMTKVNKQQIAGLDWTYFFVCTERTRCNFGIFSSTDYRISIIKEDISHSFGRLMIVGKTVDYTVRAKTVPVTLELTTNKLNFERLFQIKAKDVNWSNLVASVGTTKNIYLKQNCKYYFIFLYFYLLIVFIVDVGVISQQAENFSCS